MKVQLLGIRLIIKYDMVIFNYRVLVRSFRGEVSTETTKFSFLALFEVRISCDVLDISNDSGRFRDPLPTISTALRKYGTRCVVANISVCYSSYPILVIMAFRR
jgi:hypothetical protein